MVLAISVDPPDKSAAIVESHRLGFAVLSDARGEAIRAYGVVHEAGNPIDQSDIARPATFIVDREGRIAGRDLTENWRVRPRAADLLAALERIP